MTEPLYEKMAHVQGAVAEGRYRYTFHGAQQLIARRLQRRDVEQAAATGEIIEDYPEHHYGPACLVLGRTAAGEPLHMVCSLRERVDIITVYRPDPEEWEHDWKTRRRAP